MLSRDWKEEGIEVVPSALYLIHYQLLFLFLILGKMPEDGNVIQLCSKSLFWQEDKFSLPASNLYRKKSSRRIIVYVICI